MTNVMALHGKLDMLKERAESATTTQYVLVVAKILATLKGVRIGSVCVCVRLRESVCVPLRERERVCVCACYERSVDACSRATRTSICCGVWV
jgi:hypothetical protein